MNKENKTHDLPTGQAGPEKEKILSQITELYLKEGFYKTSMDSIAEKLQISKKTIYKYFHSKDILVEEVVFNLMNTIGSKVDSVLKKDIDALGKLFGLFEIFGDTVLKFTDKWLYDLRTHTPALWRQIDDFRTKKMLAVLSQLLEQGKKEGTISDVPFEIMTTVLVSSIRAIVNPDFLLYNKYSYKEAVQVIFNIFFKGVLTPSGRKQFKTSISGVNK